PVFAGPVFAGPVFASPVFAGPVFASPVFASPVFASIEQPQNGAKRILGLAVGEGHRIPRGRVSLIQIPCQARLAVSEVAGADVSSHEANHDQRLAPLAGRVWMS